MKLWKTRLALGAMLCVYAWVGRAYFVPGEDDALPESIVESSPSILPAEADHSLLVTADTTPEAPTKKRPTDLDYDKHIVDLKKQLPAGEFHIVLQKPFVVIGNESKTKVSQRVEHTVKWAVDRIKKDYFRKDPNEIINIWLFKDKPSYELYATKWFGGPPTTPFGYYSPHYKALVMNISTGGGTLVHEIVHPFIQSNFPGCPSWFNEGLASLYEQSRDNDGKIWGSTNWRLKGLQEAITAKKVPRFETLCNTTTNEFYRQDRGTNYAQARYLCFYLQEHKLLRTFYHSFAENVEKDPSGFDTLKTTLSVDDMVQFQKKWEAYVMHLRF